MKKWRRLARKGRAEKKRSWGAWHGERVRAPWGRSKGCICMVNPSKRPQQPAPLRMQMSETFCAEKKLIRAVFTRALSSDGNSLVADVFLIARQKQKFFQHFCLYATWEHLQLCVLQVCIWMGCWLLHLLRGEKNNYSLRRDPLFVARLQLFVFVIGKNAEGVIKALFPRRMHFLFISQERAVSFFQQMRAKNKMHRRSNMRKLEHSRCFTF